MLELVHVVKKYKNKNGRTVRVFRDLNYAFPHRGLLLVTGRSGSGKSTLINLITGNDFIYEGKILLQGKDIREMNASELEGYRTKFISYMFQNDTLLNDLTVLENLKISSFLLNDEPNQEYIISLVNQFQMGEYLQKYPYELSMGQKQRIAMIRALIKKPKILICDEPTSALDSKNANVLMGELKKISENILVVVISHDKTLVQNYCDETLDLTEEIQIKAREETVKEDIPVIKPKYKISFGLAWEHILKNKKTVFFYSFFIMLLLSAFSFFLSVAWIRTDKLMDIHFKDVDVMVIDCQRNGDKNYKEYIMYQSQKIEIPRPTGTVLVELEYYQHAKNITGAILCSESFLEERGYHLLYGTFPQKENEILVSKFYFEYIAQSYFMNLLEEPEYDPNVIYRYDIITRIPFENYVITGILDLEPDKHFSEFETKYDETMHPYAPYSFIYVNQDNFPKTETNYVFLNPQHIKEYVPNLVMENPEYWEYHSETVGLSYFCNISKWISLAFVILIIPIIAYFVYTYLKQQKQMMKNLKCMGMSTKMVVMYYAAILLYLTLFTFLITIPFYIMDSFIYAQIQLKNGASHIYEIYYLLDYPILLGLVYFFFVAGLLLILIFRKSVKKTPYQLNKLVK